MRHATSVSLVLLIACSETGTRMPQADAPATTSPDAAPKTLPTWMLEDVQPQSPRAGQTYGLDTFSGKIVVVTLVEGF
jgi:hypothetical protein